MSPPAWAYQVDNFNPPPDDELICSICQAVFCDPVQSPCHHVFCRNCIVKWVESNRNCPICRKRTSRTTLEEVVPLIKNMIMKLTLYCHNSGRGCGEKFTLESCESHIKVCPYELVQCKNKPCKLMFMKRDLQDHESNTCPHSFVRCSTCSLKILTVNPSAHNCIEELQKSLKEKSDKLKKAHSKLKKMKEKIKRMKENNLYSSGSSSGDSLSPADVFFTLTENSNLSSGSSTNLSSIVSDSLEESYSDWNFTSTGLFLEDGRRNDLQRELRERMLDLEMSNIDTLPSIESVRSFSQLDVDDFAPDPLHDETELSFELEPEPPLEQEISVNNDEPQIRRPPKRRLNNRVLDTSDDDEEDKGLDTDNLPSRKRTWRTKVECDSSVDPAASNDLGAAGPSYFSSAAESSTSNTESPTRNRNRFRLRPKLRSRSIEQRSSAISAVSADSLMANPTFDRTISLLEQYNLESDPEWLPSHRDISSDSFDSDNDSLVMSDHITSSDESSVSELDSDTSYEDAAEGRTEDLLNNFYGSSDSDSDEWLPQ